MPINGTTVDAVLASEFEPFLRPNVFCDYDADSACVAKASELAVGAQNEGDVLCSIYTWIAENISYDTEKAERFGQRHGLRAQPRRHVGRGKGHLLRLREPRSRHAAKPWNSHEDRHRLRFPLIIFTMHGIWYILTEAGGASR